MLPLFKKYIEWRRRTIAINETSWEVYAKLRSRLRMPSVTVAGLQLKRELSKQGIEIDQNDAIVKMRKLMKGC